MNEYPKALRSFAAQLPVPLYAVGGCVRDALLGRPAHDVDLASALLPEQMQRCAERAGLKCPIVNERLGTVLLCIGDRQYEHTTFRIESYPAGGAHTPSTVAFTDSIEKDARRRDFSINAIYQDVCTGALVDPTGGLADIRRRRIRTTTEDPARILRDDGLRILRLIRFAVDTGFGVEPRTRDCAVENAALLDDVAWERRRDELSRILLLDDVFRALQLLRLSGALQHLIPELCAGEGVTQRADYHRYDVLEHAFRTCAATPKALPLRLMGLLHDVGKPQSYQESGNFRQHQQIGAAMTETILRRLRYPNALIARVKRAVEEHMFDVNDAAREATVRRRFVQIGKQGTEDLIALREADMRGSGVQTDFTATRWRGIYAAMLAENCPWSVSELQISGDEVMAELGLGPSPAVADVLGKLLLHCAAYPQDNRPDRLRRAAREVYRPKA